MKLPRFTHQPSPLPGSLATRGGTRPPKVSSLILAGVIVAACATFIFQAATALLQAI